MSIEVKALTLKEYSIVCTKLRSSIIGLDRQLAEAQKWIAAKCTITGCWKSKYEEAQEKLDAVQEYIDNLQSGIHDVDARPHYGDSAYECDCVTIARILKGD